jgi:hypothetical protein
MNYFTNEPDAVVLVAMLAGMGHRLHTTQVQGPLERAAMGNALVRCRTLWQPALDAAERHGGSGAADAAVCLAMEGVDLVVADGGFPLAVAAIRGLPVFRSDDLAGVLGAAR